MEENSKTDLNVFLSIYWSRISLENSWYQAVDRELGPAVRATTQAMITPISDAVTFPPEQVQVMWTHEDENVSGETIAIILRISFTCSSVNCSLKGSGLFSHKVAAKV